MTETGGCPTIAKIVWRMDRGEKGKKEDAIRMKIEESGDRQMVEGWMIAAAVEGDERAIKGVSDENARSGTRTHIFLLLAREGKIRMNRHLWSE